MSNISELKSQLSTAKAMLKFYKTKIEIAQVMGDAKEYKQHSKHARRREREIDAINELLKPKEEPVEIRDNVWVLVYNIDYEGSSIYAVYTSEEKAVAEAAKRNEEHKNSFSRWDVHGHIMNQPMDF